MSVAGMFLPAGTNVVPEPCIVGDHNDIQEKVGGIFDAVTNAYGDDNQAVFVGYVNDTGLVDGMPLNYLATALFNRELHGDCVVVWGLDSDGVYDGENHDLPQQACEFISGQLLLWTAEQYNEAVLVSVLLREAVERGFATKEEVISLNDELYNYVSTGNIEALPDGEARLFELLDKVMESLTLQEQVQLLYGVMVEPYRGERKED